MEEVEHLCDRLLMINNGRAVLYGYLSDIRKKFAENTLFLEYNGELDGLSGFDIKEKRDGYAELELTGISAQELLKQLVRRHIEIKRFELSAPTLNEIFIKMAGEKNE